MIPLIVGPSEPGGDRLLPRAAPWPRDRYLELAPKYWAKTRARLDPEQLKLPLGSLTMTEPEPPAQQTAPS